MAFDGVDLESSASSDSSIQSHLQGNLHAASPLEFPSRLRRHRRVTTLQSTDRSFSSSFELTETLLHPPTSTTLMTPLFTSSTHLVHADFPDGLSQVFTAGDIVRGTVNLTLASQEGKKGKQQQLKIESVSAKLRVVQTSTYYRSSNNSQGELEFTLSTKVGSELRRQRVERRKKKES